MPLLDSALGAVFGAALAPLMRDAVLHKVAEAGAPGGRFTATTTDYPVKASRDSVSATDRAASGLPADAVRLVVLLAGLPVTVELDDGLTLGGASYRVIGVEGDPAGAAAIATGVPA